MTEGNMKSNKKARKLTNLRPIAPPPKRYINEDVDFTPLKEGSFELFMLIARAKGFI